MSRSIDARTLKQWLQDGLELALLDVREAGQFGEGHLFFATSVPYSELELVIGRLIPRTGTRIVVQDEGDDALAARAISRLAAMGYSNLHLLCGGCAAWSAAGYQVYKGVNLPSKTFGELVEHAYDTPRLSVTELDAMLKRGDDVVVLDGRPWTEYTKMSIPSGICCPNGELAYRVGRIVTSPNTKIVVNCAGRTRSILGAQTLRNFGVPNPVYALENGTQGWLLADLHLDHGASRRYPEVEGEIDLPALREKARSLALRHGVEFVAAATVQRWLEDEGRNVFLCDVRTPEEFARGSIAGAQHTPGGQFIQATDQYVGVRNARVIVFDSELVRAPVCASWLAQMKHEVYVLNEGVGAALEVPPGPQAKLPALSVLEPAALDRFTRDGVLVDLRSSAAYRQAHVDGAIWGTRARLDRVARLGKPIALMADTSDKARLAGLDLLEAGLKDVRIVGGDLAACRAAGLPAVATAHIPADADRIDFLFFVHDRHEGNKAAMRGYLQWETGLLAQLDEQERSSFRLPPASH